MMQKKKNSSSSSRSSAEARKKKVLWLLENYRVTSSPMIQLNSTVIIGTLIELNQANKW